MGHYKVVGSNGEVYGRVAIPVDEDGERKAKAEANKIIEMRKNHKGDKGPSSPSSNMNYSVEFSPENYPKQ